MVLQTIGKSTLQGSRISLGCMRMSSLNEQEAARVIETSVENGIQFFDHADIYGGGQSESIFAQGLKRTSIKREDIILQSKCGIQKGYFDFSKEHIMTSTENILKRLDTDYLDVLVLHRPDTLMEPEEVAQAFQTLKEQGKVRYFGVSNQNRYQIELLQSYLKDPLVVNQVQLSPAHTPLFDAGLTVNMKIDQATMRDAGTLEYCRLHNITLQAWSPFQVSLSSGVFMTHPDYKQLAETIEKYAQQYGVSAEAITVAWLLRHPAHMQVIIGSMNSERIERITQAYHVTLSRPEWYDIYMSAGNILP